MSTITVEPQRWAQHPSVVEWLGRPDPPQKRNFGARRDTAEAINAWLDRHGWGPHIDKVGDHTDREEEYITILCAVDFGNICVVTFATIKADGTRGIRNVVYDINGSGSILIPTLNIYDRNSLMRTTYLVKQSWYPAIGRHLIGTLRGPAQPPGVTVLPGDFRSPEIADLPLSAEEQRICEVIVGDGDRLGKPVTIGEFYQNPTHSAGTFRVYTFAVKIKNNPHYGMTLDVEAAVKQRLKELEEPGERYLLLTKEQLMNRVLGCQNRRYQPDGVTAAVLYLADNYFHSQAMHEVPLLR